MEKLETLLKDKDWTSLPHDEHVLSKMVLFNLRIGNIVDLNKWLPTARLRPHVVLKLMWSLVDRKYPAYVGNVHAHRIKAQMQKLVEEKYPEREGHLPEDEREGYIPTEVEKAIRTAMRDPPGEKEASGVNQKNATPPPAPERISAALTEIRPSVLLPDRDCKILENKESRDRSS